MAYLLVFIGGGLGSLARFGLSKLNGILFDSLPLGTLLANILASLILGLVVYSTLGSTNIAQQQLRWLLVSGFCGGFSTFSTFSYETFLLIEKGLWTWALANIVINVALCILLVWIARFWIG